MNVLVAFSELEISPELILNEIGYGTITPDAIVSDTLYKLYSEIQKEAVPEFGYIIDEGELLEKSIIIRSIVLNPGNTINSLLKNSVRFVLFAATAGERFEQMTRDVKSDGDLLKIYLMDAIGSCLVEKTGDFIEKHLESKLGDMNHTNRFSPGYCGWHLTEQRKLFELLGNKPCGITLSDVCLMTPVKSISGIIGIGERVSKKRYACNICELKTCYKRKK